MDSTSIITLAVSLLGVLAVGVLVPVFLVGRAETTRRADAAEAARLHREDREAEWARQDEISARVTQNAADQAENQKQTNSKLDAIHTLVNSNMTAAMQSEFDAVARELAMMREVVELKRASGMEPTETALAAIDTTAEKLRDLAAALAERYKAQANIERKEGE